MVHIQRPKRWSLAEPKANLRTKAALEVLLPYQHELEIFTVSGDMGEAIAKELGFTGKGAIHPKQIAMLNEVFTPSADEIARATRIITAFEDADAALVVIDGKLIEKPVIRTMQRILAIAEHMKKLDPSHHG